MIAMGFPRNLKHATARREAGKKQSEESCLGLSRVTVWFSVAQSEPDRKTYFCTMARLWVGGLEVGISERDLEDEVRGCTCRKASKTNHPLTFVLLQFTRYGRLRSVWVARKVR